MSQRRYTKPQRQLIKDMSKMGWHLHRHTNHFVFRHEAGGQLVCSSSPSDARAWTNALADARRLSATGRSL